MITNYHKSMKTLLTQMTELERAGKIVVYIDTDELSITYYILEG